MRLRQDINRGAERPESSYMAKPAFPSPPRAGYARPPPPTGWG